LLVTPDTVRLCPARPKLDPLAIVRFVIVTLAAVPPSITGKFPPVGLVGIETLSELVGPPATGSVGDQFVVTLQTALFPTQV
jgi:hypothetical protein